MDKMIEREPYHKMLIKMSAFFLKKDYQRVCYGPLVDGRKTLIVKDKEIEYEIRAIDVEPNVIWGLWKRSVSVELIQSENPIEIVKYIHTRTKTA